MAEEEVEAKQSLDRFLADNPELEQLSAKLATFNIFHALKIEDAEIRHSNTLAWLLDPTESHGLGDVFLRRILSNMLLESNADIKGISAAQVELMDLSDVEVRREWKNIDVLVIIRSKPNVVLLIENKIGSGEVTRQLIRYREQVGKEFPTALLIPVFLTLDGHPSEDDDAKDYICYSHADLLTTVTRIVTLRESQLPESVAVFLEHYLDTLRRLTMQDKDLAELCKTIYRKHKHAVDLIVQYGSATHFKDIAEDVISKDDFEILSLSNSQIWFIPDSWHNLIPTNGIGWPALSRQVSIACWIVKGAGQLGLIFEMCGMDDPDLRLTCVNRLDKAGFTFGKNARNKDAVYSRFFRHTEWLTDMDDQDAVREAIEKLIAKAKEKFPKVEAVLKEVFRGKTEYE